LAFRRIAAEDFLLAKGEERFDLAFAVRVGALDAGIPRRAARRLRSSAPR
jgi:hypothetical protein